MRQILVIFISLCCSLPSWATWTVVQHKKSTACTTSSATCSVTMTSTGTGNVIVIGFTLVGDINEQIVSVSGGGSYTHPAGCHATDSAGTFSSDCAYTLASTSGTTSITVTRTDATTFGWTVAATELSFTAGPVSVDTGTPQVRDQSTNTTTPAGVTLTLAGSNDAIYQIIKGTGTVSAATSPYDVNNDFLTSSGFATAINTVSGTAPTWTQSSNGKAALSAIAFTESSSAATNSNMAGPSESAGPSVVK